MEATATGELPNISITALVAIWAAGKPIPWSPSTRVSESDTNFFLLTTVHQNFDAYAFGLSNAQKQEWTKVKGRFREITFNEPVEQLLFLAAEHLKQNNTDRKTESEIKSALNIAKKSRAFNLNADYATEVSAKLFPLELIFLARLLNSYDAFVASHISSSWSMRSISAG